MNRDNHDKQMLRAMQNIAKSLERLSRSCDIIVNKLEALATVSEEVGVNKDDTGCKERKKYDAEAAGGSDRN